MNSNNQDFNTPPKKRQRKKIFAGFSLSQIDYALILIVFISSLTLALFGEKIVENGGFGWDGMFYGQLAKIFTPRIFLSPSQYELTSYTIQRIVPSAFIHYAMRITQQPFTSFNIIRNFAILNVGLITLSSVVWCLLCSRMKIKNTGKLLGFLGLFASFGLTKWASFYPVLTDVAAFAIGMGMLYGYLSNHKWLLLFLTVIGAFTWPTLLYEGILFLLFPRDATSSNTKISPAPYHLNIWAAGASSLVMALVFYYVAFNYTPSLPVYPDQQWLPVSILVAILFWFFAISNIINNSRIFTPKEWFKYFQPLNWLVVLITVIAIKVIQRYISAPDPQMKNYMLNLLIIPIDVPGKFFIAHIFFFGPIVLVMLYFWKSIFRFIQTQGLGLTLNSILGLLFFLSTESRNLITFLPVFILGMAQITSTLKLRKSTLWLFVFLTFVFSRVWLPLNNTPAISRISAFLQPVLAGSNICPECSLNIFYWASMGPWTTHTMYLIETVIAVIVGGILYLILGQYHNTATISSQNE